MKNIIQKTTLALAIAAVSTGAMAGDLAYTAATSGKVVLANEVFGTGSDDTLVAIPDVTFTLDVTKDDIADTETATVKLTLDSGAVFGEDLSDINKWSNAGVTLDLVVDINGGGNSTLAVGGNGADYVQNAQLTVNVTQGGAIGDNTVTFEIVDTGADGFNNILVSAQVAGFKVKNLKTPLERGVASPAVKLGAEFRNVDTAVTDTDTALTILSSQNGVELTANQVTDYDDTATGLRARIDVADTELSFTGDAVDGGIGTAAAQDFDETDNDAFVTLGTLQVERTTYVDFAAATVNVKKEDANDFDFNGSDTISIRVTSSASLASYSSVYLRTAGACDATPVANVDFAGVAVSGDANSVDISLSGEATADLSTGYAVCAVAAGVSAIPESTISAALTVGYFNPRYTDSEDTVAYGSILRNGCQVTLFNLPNPASGDKAFVRLTNISEKPGAVRGFIWTEDGTQIDLNSDIVTSLAAHATTVLSTQIGHAGYIGTAMPEFGALTTQRHRLVIQGAFPACEALGLVKTPSGVLTNMTSTTYSGDASRLGSDTNNTSNTSN